MGYTNKKTAMYISVPVPKEIDILASIYEDGIDYNDLVMTLCSHLSLTNIDIDGSLVDNILQSVGYIFIPDKNPKAIELIGDIYRTLYKHFAAVDALDRPVVIKRWSTNIIFATVQSNFDTKEKEG